MPSNPERIVCSRCGIPDFLSLSMKVINGQNVCEGCRTPAEEKRILRERYAKLGLDDSELNKKGQ